MRFFIWIFLTILSGVGLWAVDRREDRKSGLRNLMERAEAGDPKSLFDLATLYDRGFDSIPVDSAKSTALYISSALKGYGPAANYLGFRYYNGDYITKNVDSALFWIKKAADAGDITAAGNLGFLLSQSTDIPHDYETAFKWLKKAADAGLPSSFNVLGDLYRQGLGCDPDTLKALSLYEKALEAGVPETERRLIAMMGYKWLNLSPDSALSLGINYYNLGAHSATAELIEKAAEAKIPKAFSIIGHMSSQGIGLPYDHDKSVEYFFKGAIAGDPSAQFIIGELLEFFPDIITDGLLKELKEEFNPDILDLDELNNPEFWFGKASEKGIFDADSAYLYLFSP